MLGSCVSDREARPDRQGGELIDRIATGAPIGKLLLVEALGHARVPFAGFRPDHRAEIELARSCSEIVKSSGCATWREDQEGSPWRCGLIAGWMGSIFAEKALYGSDAVITNPAKSGRASGSASRGM